MKKIVIRKGLIGAINSLRLGECGFHLYVRRSSGEVWGDYSISENIYYKYSDNINDICYICFWSARKGKITRQAFVEFAQKAIAEKEAMLEYWKRIEKEMGE